MADTTTPETTSNKMLTFNFNVSKFIYALARELADTQALATTIKKGFVAEGSPSGRFYNMYLNTYVGEGTSTYNAGKNNHTVDKSKWTIKDYSSFEQVLDANGKATHSTQAKADVLFGYTTEQKAGWTVEEVTKDIGFLQNA